MTVPALLAHALARDPGRPLVTFYDEGSGERVELSVATTANWVAKTANLLQDTLGADDSTVVRIDLPLHWETQVWLLACWTAGAAVAAGAGQHADIAVVGPDVLARDGTPPGDADDVVALSLRPLGARFDRPLPVDVMDYNAEVLGHGDRFLAYYPPQEDSPALVGADGAVSHADLVDRHRTRLTAGARVLCVGDHGLAPQVEALVATLVAGGSLVLVRSDSPLDAGRRDALVKAEMVTAELG